ncbi:hypothetical protein [Nocardioides sp. YIM 152588]|uniref:hypothetical protein n=1 Tax=Nocardioides sp. YIM 152588 TaxID=3158259 RepID=UPI0032E51B56
MRPVVLILVAALIAVVGPAPRADAAARVSVANGSGSAAIDPTYATELRVSASGFQAVKGGHGGVYVFFGTVDGRWRPSQGGATGRDYFYVPDGEAADNQGYQRYVAFPGSDTAGSANGGAMSANGAWSTTITVPGAVFTAVDRDGGTRRVDCRTVTCGVITVGAHGVTNATNETFTPVRVTDLYDGDAGAAAQAETDAAEAGDAAGAAVEATPEGAEGSGRRVRLGPVALEVDRTSAKVGNVLSFRAQGLTPGAQVTAILDDGASANGPFVVGADGTVAGVVAVPPTLGPGTHELRLYGLAEDVDQPVVRFALAAADEPAGVADAAAEPVAAAAGTEARSDALAPWFFAGAALLVALALARLLLLRRRAVSAGA